jgi:hypothetical protein
MDIVLLAGISAVAKYAADVARIRTLGPRKKVTAVDTTLPAPACFDAMAEDRDWRGLGALCTG